MGVLFILGFLLTCASAATAYWSVPVLFASPNYAIAEAGSLLPPTGPTAFAHGSDEIVVEWSLPSGQVSDAGYRVTRTTGPGSVEVCAVGPVDPPPATMSCTDTGLTPGLDPGTLYEYSIVAVIGDNWQSGAVTASATTLGVTTTSLPGATVGAAYSASLTAVGGSGPYTWTVSSGTLPGWASLAAGTGVISGTPSAVGAPSALTFTVTDGLGYTANSGSLSLTVAKVATTTTVTPSVTTVTYGAESAATFAVSVRTANDAIVTDGSVTVSVGGSATCTVTLPASNCSIGDTALQAGGPYPVSATFSGNSNLLSSSGSASPGLTVARDRATVTAFSVTGTPATYGAETGLVFTASVSGVNAPIPSGSTVAVTAGPTTVCTITLTQGSPTPTAGSGSCSPTSATLLPAGNYTVTATFNAADAEPNFVTTAAKDADAPLVINPATATVALSVAPTSVVFGDEASLVFTASASAAPAVLPPGSTVTLTNAAGAQVCTMALTSGTGTCSPTSGTVLPVGPNTVTATFNAGDPNFTTATSTATVTVTSPIAGIRWTGESTTGTFTCDPITSPAAVTCTAAGVAGGGNGTGTFTASVQLVDANGAPVPNATGANIVVSQTTTGGGGDTTPTGTLTIAPGQSTSSGSFTLTMKPGRNRPPTTITASVTVGGVTYTVSCVVSK
jgi:hypothetical protein